MPKKEIKMKNKFSLLGELISEMPIWQKIVSIVVVIACIVAIALGVRAISFNSELTEAEHKFDEFREDVTTTDVGSSSTDVFTQGSEVYIDPSIITDNPEGQTPEGQTPEGQTPEGQQPEQDPASNVVTSASKHNFSALQSNNKDVYAWITVPQTKVDYPILQNTVNDYYLMRNMDGSQGYPGCLYTNKCNKKDFSDYVNIIYGHNMKNKTMFGSLHSYDDASFLKKGNTITVETTSQFINYEVIAAVNYSDNRIDYYYEVSSKKGRDDFWKSVLDNKNSSGTTILVDTLNDDDKLVVLSTCISGKSDRRFLIIGRQTSTSAR